MGVIERKEREKQKRRQDIVDAVCEVLSEKGFATATVDDVSDRVELAKGGEKTQRLMALHEEGDNNVY